MGTPFIELYPFQWVALVVAGLTLVLLADTFTGHYRSGFGLRMQYAPFLSGGLLIPSAIAATVAPDAAWANTVLRGAGWLAASTGIIGFGFHHYYGIVKKPGGYKWLLHYLMYGAPQLAPLALTATGVLALIAARGLSGETQFVGLNLRAALFIVVATALTGAIAQAGILHYRGAFNNAAMYAPLTAPALTVAVSAWVAAAPHGPALLALAVLLWLTALIGFIGLGMHLRGFDRQVGGLYIPLRNVLEGPPAWAPAFFVGIAAVGLVAVHLL
jgi:hypothetical protein